MLVHEKLFSKALGQLLAWGKVWHLRLAVQQVILKVIFNVPFLLQLANVNVLQVLSIATSDSDCESR